MANRIGVLDPRDRAAVFETAERLKIDPYKLGAVIHKESSFNPNIWGGAGGGYYGLIQFGGPERGEAGLDPAKIGKYTIREQLPHVEKWLAGRGYKPGMGVEKLYATILGGNPNANIYEKDANQTSVANSLKEFLPGGRLYIEAQTTLGDLPAQYTTLNYSANTNNNNNNNKPETNTQPVESRNELGLVMDALGLLGGLLNQQSGLSDVAARGRAELNQPTYMEDKTDKTNRYDSAALAQQRLNQQQNNFFNNVSAALVEAMKAFQR